MEDIAIGDFFVEGFVMEDLIVLCVAAIGLIFLSLILSKAPRTKGIKIEAHIIYLALVVIILWLCPEFIQKSLFSHLGVVIVGTFMPIYESIKAVVSIDVLIDDDDVDDDDNNKRVDDTDWLEFWIISGTFTYCTEWMDTIAHHYPQLAEHWHEFEFFTILWMLLPFTDGSTLLFNKLRPFLTPIAESMKKRAENKLSIFFFVINSGYLWMVWFTFLTLDDEARRFIVIAVGTLYPIACSTIACTSNDPPGRRDDSFWLTYWVCFSCLFLMMDYLETFVGSIRGFYSLCLCASVYLFLPMFKGANEVFRNVIVPLTGQNEKLFLKDIYMLKLEMEKKLPVGSREAVFSKAALLLKKTKAE